MKSPRLIEEKILQVLNAWKDLTPDKSYGGLTLAQFEARFQPSFDTRRQAAQIENQLGEAIDLRADADEVSLDTIQLIVNGVVGDPTEGPDSPVYERMGYKRKSERKTGLTRKKKSGGAKE